MFLTIQNLGIFSDFSTPSVLKGGQNLELGKGNVACEEKASWVVTLW